MNYINALSGWSLGYQASRSAHLGEEHWQGKNYHSSALCQMVQLINLTISAGFLNNYLQKGFGKTALKVMSSSMFILSGFALIQFSSIVKRGEYPTAAQKWNEFAQIRFLQVSADVSWKAKKIYHLFSEYSGKVIRLAEIACGVAVAIFFNPYYGGGILAGHLFEVASGSGLIPRKTSLFMETYLPIVSLGVNFVYGDFLRRAISIYFVATVVAPKINGSLHHKFHYRIDSIVNNALKSQGDSIPKLSDFDAPLQYNAMSFEAIQDVLQNPLSCEINPAHCSKPVIGFSPLLEDRGFDKMPPYAESLQKESRGSEVEDGQLKLVVEGDEHCALGIKKATDELEDTILHRLHRAKVDGEMLSDDPHGIERRIRVAMHECRRNIIQREYKYLTDSIGVYKIAGSDDAHTFDYLRVILSRGFFPLTDIELFNFNIYDLALYELFAFKRKHMFREYAIKILLVMEEIVDSIGNSLFTEYVRSLIEKNEKLIDSQKKVIAERISEGLVTDSDLQRLALVSLGILRRRSNDGLRRKNLFFSSFSTLSTTR